jgi:DNA-binding transcriptional MerR regulator
MGMKTLKWRIDELAGVVARALGTAGYDGQPSRRVRGVPDLRTIRYYTTLGILDGPLEMQGRTAYYGWRHLLQLVAIKRLQAAGCSLVAIQQRLSGADNRRLSQWADLPKGLAETVEFAGKHDEDGPAGVPRKSRSVRRDRFWAELPEVGERRVEEVCSENRSVASPAATVRIAPGALLVLEGVEIESLGASKRSAIESAAAALRRALEEAGLAGRTMPQVRNDAQGEL